MKKSSCRIHPDRIDRGHGRWPPLYCRFAVPSFHRFMESNRVTIETNHLMANLQYARNAAIKPLQPGHCLSQPLISSNVREAAAGTGALDCLYGYGRKTANRTHRRIFSG